MELTHLRYFFNVARARSFVQGARRSHVSPPAVSKAIKKLEAELLELRTTKRAEVRRPRRPLTCLCFGEQRHSCLVPPAGRPVGWSCSPRIKLTHRERDRNLLGQRVSESDQGDSPPGPTRMRSNRLPVARRSRCLRSACNSREPSRRRACSVLRR